VNFATSFKKGGPAVDLEVRIVGIKYAGNAAVAGFEALNWRGTRYTDFLRVGRADRRLAYQEQGLFSHIPERNVASPRSAPRQATTVKNVD
jgi:hypothetical protein